MYQHKTYLALIISLMINFSVFYSLHNSSQQTWELSQNELTLGENLPALLENMSISSMKRKVEAQIKKTNEKAPPEKTLKKSLTAMHKKVVPQQETPQPTTAEKSHADALNENSNAAGKATPQITQKAQLRSAPPPLVYPQEAVKESITGKVTLSASINEEGKIGEILVQKSSGSTILDEAAIGWFKQLKFNPASDGKNSISSKVTQTIAFSLKDLRRAEQLETT